MKTYRYRIFNLTIESTLECPDLIPGDYLNPDVTLRRGKVPDALTDAVVRTDYYQASDNQFLLNIENVAKYLITNGKQILIDKYPEGNEDSVMVFLLGSAMGALLHQRGMLPLHASAIEFRARRSSCRYARRKHGTPACVCSWQESGIERPGAGKGHSSEEY